jgi:hypothetical protein
MATTVTSHHGYIPAVRQSEKISARALGHIVCAHFRSLYPTLLRPGAKEFVVVWRAFVTSRGVTRVHCCCSQGGGSLGCHGEVLRGFLGKKHA